MITAITFWIISGLVGFLLLRLQLKIKGDWNRKNMYCAMPLIALGFLFFMLEVSEVQEELLAKRRRK